MTSVHANCCKHCPSQPGMPLDPECEDILTWDRASQIETLFACGWRPHKLCRGYVNMLAATKAEIDGVMSARKAIEVACGILIVSAPGLGQGEKG